MSNDTQRVKIEAELSRDVVDTLKAMAEKFGVTPAEMIRRSVMTEKYFLNALENNDRILIEDRRGNIREITGV